MNSASTHARLGIRFFIGCALIIHLIIQTIGLDPSRAVWTDEASNVSRPDPSGADQVDAEHPARNRKVEAHLGKCKLQVTSHGLAPATWRAGHKLPVSLRCSFSCSQYFVGLSFGASWRISSALFLIHPTP
jgi:hypothetical protein